MIEEITKFVENLKSNLRLLIYGEEATKQSIILPLLNLLGWNVFTIDVGVARCARSIIELKVDLSRHTAQTHNVICHCR